MEVSPTIKVTSRETYSLLEYFGDIGGLYEFLRLIVGLFVSSFGSLNLKAFVANKLYSWLSPESGKREAIPNWQYLEIHHTFQRFILCCCRQQWYRKYESALSKVDDDLLQRFDFIKFSKRLSQHTAALNLTVKHAER